LENELKEAKKKILHLEAKNKQNDNDVEMLKRDNRSVSMFCVSCETSEITEGRKGETKQASNNNNNNSNERKSANFSLLSLPPFSASKRSFNCRYNHQK